MLLNWYNKKKHTLILKNMLFIPKSLINLTSKLSYYLSSAKINSLDLVFSQNPIIVTLNIKNSSFFLNVTNYPEVSLTFYFTNKGLNGLRIPPFKIKMV